jgi:hypothetical protein
MGLVLLAPAFVARADDLDLGTEAAASNVSWSGNLLVRQDVERSFPGGDNESRLLFRLYYGPNWQINDKWLLGAALRLDESTIGNEYLVDYNDNLRPRDLALDSLYLQCTPAEGQAAEAGKDILPLALSRMLWDPNLRPAGFSYFSKDQLSDATSLHFVAGAFLGQHLAGDQSRIYGAQLGMRFREQNTVQPEFILSYLHFTSLGALAITGENRGNPPNEFISPCTGTGCTPTVTFGGFLDRFDIADLQFILHVGTPTPVRLLLDVGKNLGAVAGNDRAGRMELAFGDAGIAGGSVFGLAVERIQQSAVLGAFNSDEWWFHAGSKGVMLWYGYGWSERVRLQASWFHEQPDGSWHWWNRFLLDLNWQF